MLGKISNKLEINIKMSKKNENLAASLFATPKINAEQIVIPERDIPGKIAKHCIQPIINTIL